MLLTTSYTQANIVQAANPRRRRGGYRSVLLLDSGTLLDDAVCALLGERDGLRVCVAHPATEEEAVQIIAREQPEMVILCKSARLSAARLENEFSANPFTPAPRVLELSISGRSLEVLERGKAFKTNFSQLVDLALERRGA